MWEMVADKLKDGGYMVRKFGYLAILLIFIFASSGCATICHGTSTAVRINSVPPGATAIVGGKTVITPGKVILRNGQLYNIIFKKDGYEDAYFTIERQPSWGGWVFGNALVGGLIGSSIDNASGGAYKLVPTNINVTLTAKQEKK